jgi:hypothetical protein
MPTISNVSKSSVWYLYLYLIYASSPPLSRKQIFKDIPTVIHERKERNKRVDLPPPTATLRKSQSAVSLVSTITPNISLSLLTHLYIAQIL